MPVALRGTVAALAHPAILDHLTRLGVDAVELMPVTAWIDERHLAPLGLTNGWGYNPVAFMAPDPRLCPGGIEELRTTVATLRAAGIGTILDVVFNHTGESDAHGPTLACAASTPAPTSATPPTAGWSTTPAPATRWTALTPPPAASSSSRSAISSATPASTASASTSPPSSAEPPRASTRRPRPSPPSPPTRSSPTAS